MTRPKVGDFVLLWDSPATRPRQPVEVVDDHHNGRLRVRFASGAELELSYEHIEPLHTRKTPQ